MTESEILDKAMAGDTRAFRMLVEMHQAFCVSVAWRMVGNRDDAQDLVQEAFVRLWRNAHKYRRDVKLTTWLYKIVTNLALDFLKSKHGKSRVNRESIETQFDLSEKDSADQRLLMDEQRNVLVMLTEHLTPKQKAVFVLRDIEELPVDEVCEILSINEGNVKSNLYYARQRMSELISKYYPDFKNL